MVGAKTPLKPKHVWAIRFFLEREGRLRDRALFDLAKDSKLRGRDVVKIGDVVSGGQIRSRATVIRQQAQDRSARRGSMSARFRSYPELARWFQPLIHWRRHCSLVLNVRQGG